MTVSTYETISGTEPSTTEEHEPRTMTRSKPNEGLIQMMSEIGDCLFVAWAECAKCHARVDTCKCANGPVEPAYIARWRAERFEKTVARRLYPEESDEDSRPLTPPVPSYRQGSVSTGLDRAMDAVLNAAEATDDDD